MAFDEEQFETIYKRCFPQALGLAMSLLYDREEARDVAQQVFASLWETRVPVLNPDAFVYRAVRNACYNRIEQQTNRERIRKLYQVEFDPPDSPDQRLEELPTALAKLTERERQVIHTVFDGQRSYKEAASHLNLSVASINKHIVNALKTLRTHFNTTKP
ncbi:MAG: sigma-70 family RNA polymerase sigma factor [Muribaculaceae bacterium]|nr:sigma-70 family RNA polymerase sigma factor [Muribaculaceae bacterium]